MNPSSHSRRELIDQLYCEAMVLADELPTAFAAPERTTSLTLEEAESALAFACEMVRIDVLIAKSIRWLRSCRVGGQGPRAPLGERFQRSELAQLFRFPPDAHRLVTATEELFAQLVEIDQDWSEQSPHRESNVIYPDAWHRRDVAA